MAEALSLSSSGWCWESPGRRLLLGRWYAAEAFGMDPTRPTCQHRGHKMLKVSVAGW